LTIRILFIIHVHTFVHFTAYNDRYENKPKLITSTGGDEFFMVDDSKYYFDTLKGPKYLR
jgi:PhoPQ-activated pathogenicity-related protein